MKDRGPLQTTVTLVAAVVIVGGALAAPVLTMTGIADADVAVNDFASRIK